MIRVATAGELPDLVAIYNEAVAAGFATADLIPISVESRVAWFGQHDPSRHPIYVWSENGGIKGWCSLSAYRPGRMALRFTAEISYYVRADSQRRGIGAGLVRHAMSQCASLEIRNLFAIVLERNAGSRALLKKLGFEQWGFMPRVADFAGEECGHVYYGRRVAGPGVEGGAPHIGQTTPVN